MSQGIVTSQSRYSFAETVEKLEALLKEKGIKLFTIIDHSGADIWIAAKDTAYLEQAVPFNERKYYQILATPGVAQAVKYIVRWSVWKQPGGRAESVAIVGCDPILE